MRVSSKARYRAVGNMKATVAAKQLVEEANRMRKKTIEDLRRQAHEVCFSPIGGLVGEAICREQREDAR